MIPKIIHYCWFGRNPLPPLAKNCLESWKKFCPDYEIREWNEDTFSIASAPLYVRQAYEKKKWAFITDYVRLYAMTKFGGVYMDTDVEVTAPLDKFLHHQAFSGFESPQAIPTGIMACEKDFPLFTELLRYYDTASFYREDGSLNITTNVQIITDACLAKGLVLNGEYQEIDGFALYPPDVFCPKDWFTKEVHATERTCTIHHFDGSWLSPEQKKKDKENLKRQKKNECRCKRIHDREVFRQKIMVFLTSILKKFVSKDQYARLRDAKDRMVGKK